MKYISVVTALVLVALISCCALDKGELIEPVHRNSVIRFRPPTLILQRPSLTRSAQRQVVTVKVPELENSLRIKRWR